MTSRFGCFIRHPTPLLLLLLLVALSRLPFLDAGYGLHWDAWGNAKAAQEIAATGRYTMARIPGAPVYELTTALLAWGGPVALNGLSACAGLAAVAIFALLARQLGCRDSLLAGAVLAFCTVFYINSVTSKDFTMSLAFVLLSALCVVKDWPVRAGIALGLAMGCRLTSGAMALPLALMLLSLPAETKRVPQLVHFAGASTLVALLAFAPALARYGFSFLSYYEPVYYPAWSAVALRGTVAVWGLLGCLGIAAAIVGACCFRKARTSIDALPGYQVLAWSAVVVIYAVLYLAFPDQAGYFLPAVPFVILLLARWSPRWLFQACCLAIVAGSMLGWSHGQLSAGPVWQDRRDRLRTMASIRNFYDYAQTLEGRNVFVIGAYYHAIGLIAPESRQGHYVYLLNATELAGFLRGGFQIYYLPAIRTFEYDVHGIDLARYGGIDLHARHEAQRGLANGG